MKETEVKRLTTEERHESMRGWFSYELHEHMNKNKDIWVVLGDLGYGMFDRIRSDFPDRFVNTGASEQAMMGIGVGLAKEGKVPFVYSITNFLLYRPFETIRNYVNYEDLPVKLVGSGRDRDYAHDGISHWSEDARQVLEVLPKLSTFWPEQKEDIPGTLEEVIHNKRPSFISLRR